MTAETHVCGNCGAQTHSLVGQLQADGSWHCFNCAHGNVARTSKPLVERLRAWTRGIEDSPSGCPAGEAADEIERLTRERDEARGINDHNAPRIIALLAERDRLRENLQRQAHAMQDVQVANDRLRADWTWLRGLFSERAKAGNDIPVWLALEWMDNITERGRSADEGKV